MLAKHANIATFAFPVQHFLQLRGIMSFEFSDFSEF